MFDPNSKIVVSVVVLTYNHVDYIEQCLDSIIKQVTDFPIEIILGEDESSDGTREICQKYAANYPDMIRLFLRRREDVIYINGRPTGRFNMIESLKAARGKYIAFCEGDDYWTDPFKLQKQVVVLEDNSDCIACHHWQKLLVNVQGLWKEVAAPKKNHGYIPENESGVKEIFANRLRVKSRTILFRNLITDEFFPSWFEEVAYGDVPLSFLLGLYGDFYFLDQEMAVYRQTQQGVSSAGRNELGIKSHRVQIFRNWVDIWDKGILLYEGRFNLEAKLAYAHFYKQIIRNSKLSLPSLFSIIRFNLFTSSAPTSIKIFNSMKILQFYILNLIGKDEMRVQ